VTDRLYSRNRTDTVHDGRNVFSKEYNRPILTLNIIGLWVISRVMVKIIEELSFKGKIYGVLNV